MSDEKLRNIAKIIASTDPRITGVHLFGSQAKGTASPESDTDIAILVRPDQPPGTYDVRGPIGQKVRQALEVAGYIVGKGPGRVDFDLGSDAILGLPPERQGTLGRAFLSGRRLFPLKE